MALPTPLFICPGTEAKCSHCAKSGWLGARGLHAKQQPIKAGLVWPAAPGRAVVFPAHFSALLSGSLTRLSSLSSFAISTSGPFLTSWPFFSCEESKQGRAVSREDLRDGEVSNTEGAAGYCGPAPSPHQGLIHICLSLYFKPKVP